MGFCSSALVSYGGSSMQNKGRPHLHARFLVALSILAGLLAAHPSTLSAEAGVPGADIIEAALETARAASSPQDRTEGTIAVAEELASAGLLERARQVMDEAVLSALESPSPGPLLGQAALACARNGLYDDAKGIADRMGYAGGAQRALLEIASAEMQAGRREEALQTLERARRKLAEVKYPDSAARGWAKLARSYHDAGERAQCEAALEQAARISEAIEEEVQREAVLEEIARAWVEVGQAERAIETACTIESAQVCVSALADLAASADLHGDEGAAAHALELAQQHAEGIGDAYRRAQMLALVADAWIDSGQRSRAASVLAAGEAAARAVADRRAASRAISSIAGRYAKAGDMRTAGRLIRDVPDALRRSQVATQLSAQHATEGRYADALRILDAAETKHIAYAGEGRIKAIAEAHYHVLGGQASRKDIRAIKPPELRDAVLARYADARAGEGRYDEAISLADAIDNTASRDDALMSLARRCLDDADSAESAAPARKVLDLLHTGGDRLRLRARLAQKQAEVGLSEDATRAVRGLVEDLQQEPTATLRSELLLEAAVTLHRLGLREEARGVAAEAMGAALKIGCASCRDEAMEEMFGRLSSQDLVQLAFAAAEPIELPWPRAHNFLRICKVGGDIAPENREKLLRGALQASTEIPLSTSRLPLLLSVASAYRQAGLEVTEAEREMLRESHQMARQQPPEAGRVPTDLPVNLVYFERPSCPECEKAKAALEELRSAFPGLQVVTVDLTNSEEAALLNEAMCEGLSVPRQQRLVAPSVFGAKGALIGSDITGSALNELALKSRGWASPLVVFSGRETQAQTRLARAYEDLGILVVISAGLLDGVNPCAFTVIIFFLSYLAYMGRSRREIATVGIVFTAAVFVTYFAIGVGLAGLLSTAEAWSSTFRRVLYGATAVLVLGAALLSLRDAVLCLKGQTADLVLSLPKSLQSKIRLTISKRARLGLTVLATAVLGGLVALFEFPCTGQVYLPVIVFGLQHLPQFVWGPVGWLLIYNLCFIVPLVVIFVAVLFGLTSERLTSFFRRHMAATKFAMAGLFAVLFAVMVAYLVQ